MPALVINVLGPLRIHGRIGARTGVPDGRALATLALLALRGDLRLAELMTRIWGAADGAVPSAVEELLAACRRELGLHSPNLTIEQGIVRLHRELETGTGEMLSIAVDADRFYAVNIETASRAVLLAALGRVHAEVARGVPFPVEARGWRDAERSRQRVRIGEILQRLGAVRDLDGLVDTALEAGGLAAFDSLEPSAADLVPDRALASMSWRDAGVNAAISGMSEYPTRLQRPGLDFEMDKVLSAVEDDGRARSRFVLLSAPPAFGKTRALYDAALRHPTLAQRRTIVPRTPRQAAVALGEASAGNDRVLFWLDDLDSLLARAADRPGLTAAIVATALERNAELVILATAGGKGTWTHPDHEPAAFLLRPSWLAIADQATRVERALTPPVPAELDQAQELGWPSAIVDSMRSYGLGPALSGGPSPARFVAGAGRRRGHHRTTAIRPG